MNKIDLRKSKQNYLGFYIWKRENNRFDIGKNGTSIHTFLITKNSNDIKKFIVDSLTKENKNE